MVDVETRADCVLAEGIVELTADQLEGVAGGFASYAFFMPNSVFSFQCGPVINMSDGSNAGITCVF